MKVRVFTTDMNNLFKIIHLTTDVLYMNKKHGYADISIERYKMSDLVDVLEGIKFKILDDDKKDVLYNSTNFTRKETSGVRPKRLDRTFLEGAI